jgi:hypothetical protein
VLDLLGEGGSGEVHRSPVLCGVQVELCVVTRLTKANKEEEDFVDVAPGWG